MSLNLVALPDPGSKSVGTADGSRLVTRECWAAISDGCACL